jgi:hypothetical protein
VIYERSTAPSTLLIFGDYFLNVISLGGLPEDVAKAAEFGADERYIIRI